MTLRKSTKAAVVLVLITILSSCSLLSGPSETKKFDLPPEGGYQGKPVGNCDQRNADEVCEELGYDQAESYRCGTVHVSGGFWGPFDQDVMYSVTCSR